MSEQSDLLRIISEREAALYAALSASDCDALAEIFSDDLLYVHSPGIAETKAENLAGQRSGLYKKGPIRRLSGHTDVLGEVAVTSCVIDMVNTTGTLKGTVRLLDALVWVREGGAWRLLVRQATRLPQ
jgi:ketosteroid isomerase-like protein